MVGGSCGMCRRKNDWKVIARGDMGETGKWGENEDLLFLRL